MPSSPASMQAVRIDRFGGPDVMQTVTIDTPQPQGDEVLVRIGAASLNPVDFKVREGKYPAVKEDKLPYILGRDFCGDVVAVANTAAGAKNGDVVFGLLDVSRGSYAEYVIAKPNEIAAKPSTLDVPTAAAVPLAGLTAWQGLFRHGQLKKGQRVLIHAGSGGVGHFAVQFAHACGAHVVATASSDQLEFVRGLGADQVVDYKKQKFEEVVSDIDLVYDLIGGDTQERSFSVLKRGGTLVSTLTEPSQDKAAAAGVRALRYTAESSSSELKEIADLIDAGKVKPTVSKVSPFKDAPSALETLEQGHTVGKSVLVMDAADR